MKMKKVLAGITAASLVLSSLSIALWADSTDEKVLSSTETELPAWYPVIDLRVGRDISLDDLETYDNFAVTFSVDKLPDEDEEYGGLKYWQGEQAIRIYGKADGEGYEYNENADLNKSVEGDGIKNGVSNIEVGKSYTVKIAIADVLDELQPKLHAGDDVKTTISSFNVGSSYQAADAKVTISKVSLVKASEEELASLVTVPFEDKEYEFTVELPDWEGATVGATINTDISIDGVELGTTTISEIKNKTLKLTGIEFRNCDDESITADDITVCMFIQDPTYSEWITSSYTTMGAPMLEWDLSKIPAGKDNIVIQKIGYQLALNIDLTDIALGTKYIVNKAEPEEIPAESISLSPNKLSLYVGDEATLTKTVEPSDTTDEIVWTSSDNKVATVKDGVVTAKGKGTATITAKAREGVSATCEVEVKLAATGLSLNDMTVLVGEEIDIVPNLTPAGADKPEITYKSSDTSIFTVTTENKIKGVAAGKATLTAEATVNGTKLTPATCEVTVTKEAKPATEVTLNKSTLALEVGDTETLTVTFKPTDTTDNITWTSSDTAVATVNNNGEVEALKVGEAIITAKANDTAFAKCTVTVSAKVSEGEGEVDPDEGLKIEVDDEDITIEADAGAFEDSVTTVKAEVSVTEEAAEEKTEAIADAVKDILDGEESEVKVGAVISIVLKDQDGNEIQPISGGVVTVTVPYDGESNYAAYIDGAAPEFIKLAIDEAGEYASFDAKHFSDYYLVALSDEAADAVDKENGEDNNLTASFVDKTYTLEVTDASEWSEGLFTKSAEASTALKFDGVATYGDIKDKIITLNGIIFKNCEIEGIGASDVDVLLYMLYGDNWSWAQSEPVKMTESSVSWDMSTISAADSDVIKEIGYQVNIKGTVAAVEAMEVGDKFKINAGSGNDDSGEVNITFNDEPYELTVADASGWGGGFTRAAQANTVLNLDGVTYEETTYGDIKNKILKLNGIVFKNCEIEGVGASDIEVSLFLMHGQGDDWFWEASEAVKMTESSLTWDLSKLTMLDGAVIRQIGYQINIKGSDVAAVEAMNVGDKFKINVDDGGSKNKVEKTHKGSVVVNDEDWWTEAEIPLEDLIGEFDPDDVQSVAFTCEGHAFVIGYNTADDWAQEEVAAGETAVYTDILLKEIPAPTEDDPDAIKNYYLKVCISAGNGVDYTISWVTTALVEDDGSGSGDNNSDNINISFIDKPYELKVVDAPWGGEEYTKAAQANTEVNVSGITNGTTTFGEIKDKTITLSDIVYRSCGLEGVEASDIEVCIYMLYGELGSETWVGSQTGSMEDTSLTWDLSTLAAAREAIPDSSPIQAIGYQINISGRDIAAIEDMEVGDIIEVNFDGDANSVVVTFEDKTYELAVVDASEWGEDFTRAAQVNTVLDLSGVTYDATTYGDIKNMKLTLNGIKFKNCEIEGIGASDIDVSLFMMHGEYWSWEASAAVKMTESSVTWDLSTLSAPDSDVIRQIGYQINIKGSDVAAVEAMNVGDTFKINVEGSTPPPESTPEAPSVPAGSFTVPTTTSSSAGDSTPETTTAAAPAESDQAAPSSTEEDTSTNTTSPLATKDGGDDVQPTEAGAPVPDGGNSDAGNAGDGADVGNTGAGNAGDKNAATGVTLALIPIIAAAAGVVISKKRK